MGSNWKCAISAWDIRSTCLNIWPGPDAVLPDLIVSADLEVFEDPDIFCKLKDDLYPVRSWMSLRSGPMLDAVERGPFLLPFLSIPLVYYTREPEVCGHTALADWNGLAFGGINNSAVKTVVKAVWERWGHQAAEALLERSLVTDMPIGAFQTVRQGQASTALGALSICPAGRRTGDLPSDSTGRLRF